VTFKLNEEESMEATIVRRETRRPELGTLALAGAILLLAQALAAAVTQQSGYPNYAGTTGDVLADALFAAGLLVGLAGLEAARRALAPRLGALAIVGQAALVIAILATVAANHDTLGGVYVAGTIAWLTGLVAIAVAAVRSRDALWLPAIALPPAGFSALAIGDAGGAVLLGLAWLVLGTRLRATS